MKTKILVAEDEDGLRMIYRMMLGDGYEVIEAVNGQEAVELYKEHRPDLTLMDIKMPVMNGDEAIRHIFDIDPSAKIIAVTAYRFTEEELGVPVLRKGFDRKTFLDLVREAIGEE